MRGPPAVLVHGQLHILLFCKLDEPFSLVQIEHERLLAEHVLAGFDRGANDRQSLLGMRGDIDNFHVVSLQHLTIIGVNLRPRIEFVTPLLRFGFICVAQRHHIISSRLIRL